MKPLLWYTALVFAMFSVMVNFADFLLYNDKKMIYCLVCNVSLFVFALVMLRRSLAEYKK